MLVILHYKLSGTGMNKMTGERWEKATEWEEREEEEEQRMRGKEMGTMISFMRERGDEEWQSERDAVNSELKDTDPEETEER